MNQKEAIKEIGGKKYMMFLNLNEKSRFKKKKWWSIVLCDADNQDEDQELIMAFNFMEVIGNWDETVFMKWWE